jgi:ADP-heptose:LPS heptosyltransferase
MATGVISKYKQDNNCDIDIYTETPIPLELLPEGTKYVKDYDKSNYDKVFDLDGVYEASPEIPAWQAYEKFIFGSITDEHLECLDHDTFSKIAILHPAVITPTRTINFIVWEKVAEYLLQQGYLVIVLGITKDFKLTEYKNLIDLRGQLDIDKCYELIKTARIFVGVDSGLMHLSCSVSVQRPTVGIFTVANPEYRVQGWRLDTAITPDENTCRFCLNKPENKGKTSIDCPYPIPLCVNNITPEKVINKIKEVLND